MIKTTYRDIEISYDEFNEKWTCDVAEKHYNRQDLKEIKKSIDKYLDGADKIKKKFNRFDIISARWGEFKEATVTSISEDGNVYVTDEKGERNKFSEYDCRNLYLKNDSNLSIISQMKEIDKQATLLENKREALKKTLETVKPKEILKLLETN